MENLALRWWTRVLFSGLSRQSTRTVKTNQRLEHGLETQDGGMQGGRVQQVYGDVQYAVRQHQLCCSSMQLLTS